MCDLGLGVPFNWTSYATLLAVVSEITNHEPGEVIWQGGDIHIYHNHFEQIHEILELDHHNAPELFVDHSVESIDDFDKSTVKMEGYESGPFVKMPIAC